jgi:hypothetical protein
MSTDQLIAITGTIAIITDGPVTALPAGDCTLRGTEATTSTPPSSAPARFPRFTFGRASMWRIVSPAKKADYRGALLIELHNA